MGVYSLVYVYERRCVGEREGAGREAMLGESGWDEVN